MTEMTKPTDAFEARLRKIGDDRYHDKHPFHQLLHGGKASVDQVRAWVVNRRRPMQPRWPSDGGAALDEPAIA